MLPGGSDREQGVFLQLLRLGVDVSLAGQAVTENVFLRIAASRCSARFTTLRI